MSLFMNILKANNGDSILPKTRSEWVYRANNNDLESDLSSVTNTLKSGLLIQCNHSKTGTIHTLTGIPENMGDLYTARFKATGDFTDGDNFNINDASYLVKAFNNSEIGTNGFKNGGIVECDISPIDSAVFLRAKSPNIPPYNPLDPPNFTYTGTYQTVIDPNEGWRIKFLTSGTFTLLNPDTLGIDVFCVGGGGGGGGGWGDSGSGLDNYPAGGAGGGGYTTTSTNIVCNAATAIEIRIGSGGYAGSVVTSGIGGHGEHGGAGSYSQFKLSSSDYVKALGGMEGSAWGSDANHSNGQGGAGGSGGGAGGQKRSSSDSDTNLNGGAGGFNGTAGERKYRLPGSGQETTTREFGETTGNLFYSFGGGGGASSTFNTTGTPGDGRFSSNYGFPEGGTGGAPGKNALSGIVNSGDGGGGGGAGGGSGNRIAGKGGAGGSGIVIIRNTRTVSA